MNKEKMIKDLKYIIEGLLDELKECKKGNNVSVDNLEYWINEWEILNLAMSTLRSKILSQYYLINKYTDEPLK